MRTDILDLDGFYAGRLGKTARDFIAARLGEAWEEGAKLRVAGFGHTEPFLGAFSKAERIVAMAPGGQGVIHWPAGEKNAASLVEEHAWPLPDASIDRILIVHGLEEAGDPRRLMREIWRVLTDDGRVIIIAAHRRGLWSMIDSTPFAAGRPYLKRQLELLLTDSIFRPLAWSAALYFPPFSARFLLRAASAWERAGARLWPGLGGVLMVEAAKEMAAPVGRVERARNAVVPARARPAIAGRTQAQINSHRRN